MDMFIILCICACGACAIAGYKGRSGLGWFVLGFLIGPFAFLVAALPAKEAQQQAEARRLGQSGAFRRCPVCAEAIRVQALKCRYCQTDLSTPQIP